MKKTYSILFFLIIGISYSQEKEIEKMKKDIEEIKKKLIDERNVDIGAINFKLKDINLYKKERTKNKIFQKTIQINKIELLILDGCIVKVKVFGNNNKVYSNGDAPISITESRFNKDDYLFTDNSKSIECVLFRELFNDFNFKPYITEDKIVIIDKDNLTYHLKKDIALNNLLDTRIYSDLLGFFGEEKNSVLQTEIKSRFIINRGNIKNSQAIPINYLNINVNYNKIDSKYRFVNSTNFNLSDLLQKSIFNAEIGLNIFKSNISKNNSYTHVYSDLGTTFSWNKFVKNLDTLSVKNTTFFIEAGIKTKLYKELGLNAGVKVMRLMTPETKGFNTNIHYPYFNFMKFNLDLFYLIDNKKTSRFFLKFNYFKSTKSNLTSNQFPQIQVGYSKLFSELF